MSDVRVCINYEKDENNVMHMNIEVGEPVGKWTVTTVVAEFKIRHNFSYRGNDFHAIWVADKVDEVDDTITYLEQQIEKGRLDTPFLIQDVYLSSNAKSNIKKGDYYGKDA